MNKRFYTLLVSPGAHGKLRKVHLPFYVVPLILLISVIGLVMAAGLATSYARMLIKVSNYNQVRSDRETLKKQYHTLEEKVSQANVKLNSLQGLASAVVQTYGFSDHRLRVTPALLTLATQGDDDPQNGFGSSFYAFSGMKNASLDSISGFAGSTLFPEILTDPSALPSAWPVHGPITAGFGERMDPFSGEGAFHPGLDISASYGTDVKSAGDGLVIEAGRDAGYGRSILIDHGNGIETRYGHLSKIFVVLGEQVKRGEVIGAVGMSGRTTGPHLHFEVLIHGAPVNPARFLNG
jgi:murein DD-endopeptidase MepM/ murein hydrolase activator NlpD